MRLFKQYLHTFLFFILSIVIFSGLPLLAFAATGAHESQPLLLAKRAGKKQLAVVTEIRHSNNKDHTRVVVDLSHAVAYKVIRHPASQTVHIVLKKARLGKSLKQSPPLIIAGGVIKHIDVSEKGKETVDITLAYKQLGAHKHLVLDHPNRVVVDLYLPTAPPDPFEIQTIVIDPGHGGKDPGAMSKRGLKEKGIVLDVSRRLKKLIEHRLKKKVIMTRNRDVFISLRKRTEIANRAHADLFISVHVNSSASRRLKGIEVYLLGRASDKRAMRVAARENAASHHGTVDLQKMILNDLEREFTKNASLELAHFTNNAIKKNLISKYPTAALGVKHAPFFVLAHTDMPAILAELSFLSNRIEEKRLRSKDYRQKAAEALLKGIEAYIQSLKNGS